MMSMFYYFKSLQFMLEQIKNNRINPAVGCLIERKFFKDLFSLKFVRSHNSGCKGHLFLSRLLPPSWLRVRGHKRCVVDISPILHQLTHN